MDRALLETLLEKIVSKVLAKQQYTVFKTAPIQ